VKGCSEIVTVMGLSSHEAMCPYRPVPCPYRPADCVAVRQRDLSVHQRTCPFRPVPCSYCALTCMSNKLEVSCEPFVGVV
jgi:TRAF-type zinc finger